MTPAQAVQQQNRSNDGRYAESQLVDPGNTMLGAGQDRREQVLALKQKIGAWTQREFAARQYADEANDEARTLHVAGICLEAQAAYPTATAIAAVDHVRLQMSDILDADGNVLGQVPWRDSRIDIASGTGHAAWKAAFDPETNRIDIAQAIKIAVDRPAAKPLRISMEEARTQVQLADAIAEEAHLVWQRPDRDDITEGTLRHGVWTADGQLAPAGADPRDGHVRVTTRTGSDMWVPFDELVQARLADELAWR